MLKPYGDKIVIFSIIKARGADGATIGEIHHDYKEITGKDSQFFSKPVEQIIGFLDSLPGLRMHTLTSGAYVWCVKDDFLDKIEDLSPDTLVQIDSSFTWTTDESDTVTSTSWRPHSDSDLEMQADVDTDADIALYVKQFYFFLFLFSFRFRFQFSIIFFGFFFVISESLDDLNAEEHTADVPILHGFELIGDNYFLSLATNELGFYKDPGNLLKPKFFHLNKKVCFIYFVFLVLVHRKPKQLRKMHFRSNTSIIHTKCREKFLYICNAMRFNQSGNNGHCVWS